MQILLDTNVPLNVFLNGLPGHERPQPLESMQVMDLVDKGRITAHITPTGYSNTYFILKNYLGKSAAITRCNDLLDITSIIGQDEAVFRSALNSGWPDVEDAGQYFAARQLPRITHLCTCNAKDYKSASGLKVVSPKQLLALLK
ncbi:MAG: hypothetical protein IPL86_06725 [Flavobacteriales bacterium]|nr:hypothetical protein [Flavobacteriales bacterium]